MRRSGKPSWHAPPTPALGLLSVRGCCLLRTPCPALPTRLCGAGWRSRSSVENPSLWLRVVSHVRGWSGGSGRSRGRSPWWVLELGDEEVTRRVGWCGVRPQFCRLHPGAAPCPGRWPGCSGLQRALTPQEGHRGAGGPQRGWLLPHFHPANGVW